jgi:hypothetical protein
MSALDYLDKLRARPEAERQRLAVWIAILVTLILAVLWLLNLRVIWHNSQEAAAEPAVQTSIWSKMATGLGESLSRIKNGWQTITNQK